jgi:hypothetical protein
MELNRFSYVVNEKLSLKENVRVLLEWAWEDCIVVNRKLQTVTASPGTLELLRKVGKQVDVTETWKIVQVSYKKDTLLCRCEDVVRVVKTKIPAIRLLQKLFEIDDIEDRSEYFFSKTTEVKELEKGASV